MSDAQLIQLKIENANITDEVKEGLRLIEDLKFFLATAPANWQENQVIRRYYLNHDEGFVSCVFWNNLYFITGTDIVRCIVYKFQHFGRRIVNRKKFEEGIFSDLRNLKCGTDALLESPKSLFLDFLYKNSCLRTQKKQKVFFWFNVPHDKLMADALERDLKKEKMGQQPTTVAEREPALSFKLEDEKMLFKLIFERYKSTDEYDQDSPAEEQSFLVAEKSPNRSTQPDAQGILNRSTPTQLPNPEDEDDFPLDYFQEGDSSEYISLDPNFHHHFKDEEAYDFIESHILFSQAPSHVEVNDEYLIEQTQPVKSSLAPLSIPVAADFNDDFFPLPLSAKFTRNSPLYDMYPTDNYYSMVHEPEYWPYEVAPNFMVVNDLNPSMMGVPSHHANPAFAISPMPYTTMASARQQAISANMMMKKRQMMKRDPLLVNTASHRITKPKEKDSKIDRRDPKQPNPEDHIPTPESSVLDTRSKNAQLNH